MAPDLSFSILADTCAYTLCKILLQYFNGILGKINRKTTQKFVIQN